MGDDLRVVLGRVFGFRMNWNFPPLFRVNEIGTTLGLGCVRDESFNKQNVEGEIGLIAGYNLGAPDVGGPRMWVFQPKNRNFHYSSVSNVCIRDSKEKSIYKNIDPRNVIVTDDIDLHDTLPTFKCWVDFSVRRHEGYMRDRSFEIMATRRWCNVTNDLNGWYQGEVQLAGETSDVEMFEAICPHLSDDFILDRLNGKGVRSRCVKELWEREADWGALKESGHNLYSWTSKGSFVPERMCNCGVERVGERYSLGYGFCDQKKN